MRLCFDSIEEIKDFVGQLKGTRGGKNKGDDGDAPAAGQGGAPAPLQPPQGGQQTGFNPNANAGFNPNAGAAPQGGFNPGGAPNTAGPAPEVQAIVARIVTRIDGAIQSGQPADQVLNWFRGQCGAEAANATLDQIKGTFLYKCAMPTLEQIAKLMNA